MVNFLTDAAGASMGSTVIMLVLMVAVFYFMLIRPENKRIASFTMRSLVKFCLFPLWLEASTTILGLY